MNERYSEEQIAIYKKIAEKYNIKFEDVENMLKAVKDSIVEHTKDIDATEEKLPTFHFFRFGKFFASDKAVRLYKLKRSKELCNKKNTNLDQNSESQTE